MPKKPANPKSKPLRRLTASRVRIRAARLAQRRRHPNHKNNGEEDDGSTSQFNNFRKGLPHDSAGRVKAGDYRKFKEACEGLEISGFNGVPIGAANFRKWESPTAGAFYDLQGADAQAVTMPPAPELGSDELAAEMAEVYLMALLRDVPFTDYPKNKKVAAAAEALDSMPFFHSKGGANRGPVDPGNLFRGEGPGTREGHPISQFLLVGTPDITVSKSGAQRKGINADPKGLIEYGAQTIDQRVRTALPKLDFMQTLRSWLKVQNGTDIANIDAQHFVKLGAKGDRRFITTARDMATFVHFDALYQAYLNACLILLASDAKLQPGFPHQEKKGQQKKTKGFAQFGGPHILTLLPEVATRALKAVRYQKFTNHRRARPEQLAGLISQYKKFEKRGGKNPFAAMERLVRNLDEVDFGKVSLLEAVRASNEKAGGEGYFLPMAFPEGSPMHPSYGAGHATVAGACVTILKSFFDTRGAKIAKAYVPDSRTGCLTLKSASPKKKLTIEGELNKLAANVSIGRNMGGVHYYTDYTESMKMGETIAHTILEEQMCTYTEDVAVKVPYFFKPGEKVIGN